MLENVPYNFEYTSHKSQKELLSILSSKVKSYICEEVRDFKFCIIFNIFCSSSKYLDELQAAKLDRIVYLLYIDELENGKGTNEIGTLK